LLNFLPLRTDTSQCGSFRELVESVRDTCLEANSREIPVGVIAQEAPELNKPAEDPRLCSFILGYYRQPFASAAIKIADGAYLVRPRELKDHTSAQLPSDAVWTMSPLPSGELKCRIEFNSGELDPNTIAGFSQAYRRILAGASAEPERKWETL
jgi:hypothetical protein